MKPGPYLPHSHSHLSPGCPHSSDPVCYPDNLTWCHACSPLMAPPVMFTCPLRSRSLGAKSCCPAPYPLTRPHLALFCNHLSHSLPHPSFSPTWSPLTWPLTDPSLNPPSATFTCHSHLSPSPVSHLTLSPAPPQHATGRLLHPPRGRRRQLPGERLQDRVRQPSVQALRGGNSEAPAPHLQRHTTVPGEEGGLGRWRHPQRHLLPRVRRLGGAQGWRSDPHRQRWRWAAQELQAYAEGNGQGKTSKVVPGPYPGGPYPGGPWAPERHGSQWGAPLCQRGPPAPGDHVWREFPPASPGPSVHIPGSQQTTPGTAALRAQHGIPQRA